MLNWLIAFLPTAIPAFPEDAILDTSGDVNALLWHRSELESFLQKTPSILTAVQIEESFLNPDVKLGGKFSIWEEVDGLPRLADCKAVY